MTCSYSSADHPYQSNLNFSNQLISIPSNVPDLPSSLLPRYVNEKGFILIVHSVPRMLMTSYPLLKIIIFYYGAWWIACIHFFYSQFIQENKFNHLVASLHIFFNLSFVLFWLLSLSVEIQKGGSIVLMI